jgi:ABC-type molybdenum transport system ATPase subunit/photorepair protein PhrA
VLPQPDQAPEQQLATLDALKVRVAKANQRFDAFNSMFAGARRGLGAVSAVLRGKDSDAHFRVAELRSWLETQAESWFSDSAVSEALLGAGASAVSVNLETKQVAWSDQGGQPRNKPLEALSSGEQAFAFTQARLARLSQETAVAANRLIALDEFGAFVSVNRMRQLAEYLQHWRKTHSADQIVLILPASQDYAALAQASSGARAERYRRMAQALEDHDYLVEEFEAA